MSEPTLRLLICAGGTGGGVYPALAVLQAFQNNDEISSFVTEHAANADEIQNIDSHKNQSALWVGAIGGMEAELVKRAGVPFRSIPAAGVHGVGWRRLPGNLVQLWKGFLASREIIQDFRPDVLFFTGGYTAVPLALASKFAQNKALRSRSILFIPDIEPGLALKTLAFLADKIAITAIESKNYFSRRFRVIVTGYPIRKELHNWSINPNRHKMALDRFRLSSSLPVLLVFGGSKGSRSINQALAAILPEVLPEMQVLHICGSLDLANVEACQKRIHDELKPEHANRYQVYSYLHEDMGAALAAADLAVSRSGASVLGELPAFGLPAILVPYPYAWRYQMVNARYLEKHGAAKVIEDGLLAKHLLGQIKTLIQDKSQLDRMRLAMSSLYEPNSAMKIVDLVRSFGPVYGGSQ